MYKVRIDHLDLKQTAESGQCFRFREMGDGLWSLVAFGRYIEIKQDGDEFTFSCDKDEYDTIWAGYFDKSTDYGHIENIILSSGDAHLKEAFGEGSGIRILRQPLWETIVTFMISQNNNIGRITGSVEAICKKAGIMTADGRGYAFPGPCDVGKGFFDDRSLGLGYRDKYLAEIYAYAAARPDWLGELPSLTYEKAMESLMERKGIGKKVASCICLFGLHHIEAFPVDTHVKQLLDKYYRKGFDFEKYKGVAGIIQQYLFYYELKH